MYNLAALRLNSLAPFSVVPYLIASRTYNMRRVPIGLSDEVLVVKFLEYVGILFLDSLPTIHRSFVRHKNPVLREKCGHGGGIVVTDRLAIGLNLPV